VYLQNGGSLLGLTVIWSFDPGAGRDPAVGCRSSGCGWPHATRRRRSLPAMAKSATRAPNSTGRAPGGGEVGEAYQGLGGEGEAPEGAAQRRSRPVAAALCGGGAVVREERRGGAREMGKRPAAARLTRAGEVLVVGGEADKRARSAASVRERGEAVGPLDTCGLRG
jgi:hypothetical protein